VFNQGSQAYPFLASDEITWKKPRSIAIVLGWSVTSASIALNVFLSGSQSPEWYILLLLFFLSVFAGMLLQDLKAIVLGVFEVVFLSILLTYIGMILPTLVGGTPYYGEANEVSLAGLQYLFRMFFSVFPIALIMGALVGGFVQDWLS
jgi:hypothetical protein